MRTRVVASVVILALLFAALIIGKTAFAVLACIACSFAIYEYLNLFFQRKNKSIDIIYSLLIGNLILICIGYFQTAFAYIASISFMIIFIYNIIMKQYGINDIIFQIFALFYIPLPLGLAVGLFSLQNGSLLIWMVFIISTFTDTSAYLIGIKFGKRKLCPSVSPKKSVEGAIAGFIGGIAGAIICGVIFAEFFNVYNPIWQYALVGAVASIFGQFGDLSASLFKRNFNKKDFSSLIPGHGGILDRIDSILFVIPIIYFYALLA